MILINQNEDFLDEFGQYEKLEMEIIKVEFIKYTINQSSLDNLLLLYPSLDKRNFTMKRSKKSQKFQLLKYASFYNHFDNILFCDQSSFFQFRINIGVGGFSGSGKSTLINAILREKRCLENQINNKNNDYFCEYSLKEYALNFIEFPGFDSKFGNFHKSVVVMNIIKDYMQEMEKQSQKIHCLLFCIKYEEILSENDKFINKIFDFLFEFKTKVFFIITQSEKSDSERFKQFKGKILNILEKVKKNHIKILVNEILGQHIENHIIPIFAFQKRFNGKLIYPFGLDDLFIALYDYFLPEKIKYDTIYDDEDNDNEIQKIINQYKLLNIFKSKYDLINSLKVKMESQALKFVFKFLICNPKYLHNISDIHTIYKIFDYVFDNFLIIYKELIDKLKEDEKLKFFKISKESRVNENDIKKIFNSQEFNKIKNGLVETKELINEPLINLLSYKIINLIVEQFLILIKEKYFDYFFINMIVKIFNGATVDLFILKNYYKNLYKTNAGKN